LTLGFFLILSFFFFAVCQWQLNGVLRWTRDAGPYSSLDLIAFSYKNNQKEVTCSYNAIYCYNSFCGCWCSFSSTCV